MGDINSIVGLGEKLSNLSKIEIPELPDLDVRNYHLADYQYELLCNYIEEFQKELDDEHEVGLRLTYFGQALTLNVTNIGYSNPSIIDFYGYCNGNKAHLIQHVSQLNFLLISVPKSNPEKPARRIGFQTNPSNEN